MNLVFHQLKKDIFRTRYLLGLWFALIVVQFSLVGLNAKPGDLVMASALPVLTIVLTSINSLLVLLLIPLVVHQEPLVGTTAFWFTRPLARTTLLRAKALYVLLLVALPILTQSVVFFSHGVTLHDVLLAVPQLVIQECSWIFMVAVLAVLTPNFARFAILGTVIAVVWYLCTFVIQMLVMLNNPFYALSILGSKGLSRMLTSSLITIAFGVAIVLLQYLGRNIRLAVVLVIVGAVLSLAAHFLWPWDYLKGASKVVQDASFKATPIDAKLTGMLTVSDQVALRGGNPLKQVQSTITFTDVPKGYFVRVSSIKSVLKTPDGQNIPTQPAQFFGMLKNNDQAAIEQALGGTPVFNMQNFEMPTALFAINGDVCSRYSTTALNYSAELKCTAFKYVISAQLPLAKGAHDGHGSEHILINEVLNQPNGVDILADVQKVNLLFGEHNDDQKAPDILQQNVIYLLLNKQLHQAVMRKPERSFNPMQFMNMGGILSNQQLHLSFGADDTRFSEMNSYSPQIDKKWLDDAVLIKLDTVPVASFERKIDVAGIKLDGRFGLPYKSSQVRSPDKDALGKISLPPNATRDQVHDYIAQILIASRGSHSASDKDTQIAMLEKVGSQNVDLLVAEASNNRNFYLARAINALALPEHKELIIAACSSNPDLMETIVKHGWQTDAKPLLLAILDNPKEYHPPSWIVGIVSFKDPSTYDGLKNYYTEHPDFAVMSELQKIPEFDLAGTVDQAWKKAQTDQRPQYGQLLQPAAQYGEPGVLDMAVKLLKGNDEYMKKQARTVFQKYTPATDTVNNLAIKSSVSLNQSVDLIAWYETNKANLNYDPQAQKFVLGPLGSQSPTPPPASILTASSMRELGHQAASGDTGAIDKIEEIRKSLYRDIDYNNERDRLASNLVLMEAAFDEIAQSIKGNDTNDPAFKSLLYATGKSGLVGFTANSFGTAAANGHKPSLDVLLQYSQNGILFSSSVMGLVKPAENGNQEAITFLIKVIDTESERPLWSMASRGLVMAANQGNPEAQRVLAKYAEYERQRTQQGAAGSQATASPEPSATPVASPAPLPSPTTATPIAFPVQTTASAPATLPKPESTPTQPILKNDADGPKPTTQSQDLIK